MRSDTRKGWVSVIIPTRNRAAFLRLALDSVAAQSYPFVEVIVVDDGSQGGMEQVVKPDGERLRYIRQDHRGAAAARNAGIAQATGEYITFLDDDDIFLPQKLVEQVAFLEAHRDVGWLGCGFAFINESGAPLERKAIIAKKADVTLHDIAMFTFISTSSVMVRRSVIDRTGGFNERMKISEDYDLWARILMVTKGASLQTVLSLFRLHSHNTELRSQDLWNANAAILEEILTTKNAQLQGRDVYYHNLRRIIERNLLYKRAFVKYVWFRILGGRRRRARPQMLAMPSQTPSPVRALATLQSAHARIAICIPAYRRPRSLERLLSALAEMTIPAPIHVMVADNDADRQQGIDICAAAKDKGYPHALTAFIVEQRGISNARNALISAAIESTEIDYIAMLDDDEWPDTDWLVRLMDTAERTDADIVAGPVRSIYALTVPAYLSHANKPIRKRPEGAIDVLDSTSNILFRAAIFRVGSSPWFDAFYALIGGGDKEFLWRMRQQGKRFAWSPAAWVNEEMPASRCSVAWSLQRAYRIGNSDMLLKLRHGGRFGAIAQELPIIAMAIAGGATMAFFGSHGLRFKGRRALARSLGKIAAIRGKLYEEYTVLHGS